MQREQAIEIVRDFVLENFLAGEDRSRLTDHTELMTTGIIDSVGTLKLITFLEEQFRITLHTHEVDFEHLNTLDLIARLVAGKRTSA
jgi:acyl carrier protein